MKLKFFIPLFLVAFFSASQAKAVDSPEPEADTSKSVFSVKKVLTNKTENAPQPSVFYSEELGIETSQVPTLTEEDGRLLSPNLPIFTPLYFSPSSVPTAEQLPEGTVVINFRNRLFFLPGDVEDEGTALYPNLGISWGITDDLELLLAFQQVDSGSPGRLGNFDVARPNNNDWTLQAKYRAWENPTEELAVSGVVSLASSVLVGDRSVQFRDLTDNTLTETENDALVVAAQLPVTYQSNGWQVTFSPTIAFFPDDNALFLQRPPGNNSESFGTTFGVSGAVSYRVNPRLTFWGDAFVPFTGNNTFEENSAQPDKNIAFDVGLRYSVNPRVGLDLFTSNRLGSFGPLALTTAAQDDFSFGFGLVFMPDFVGGNRAYPDRFNDGTAVDGQIVPGGLGYFDGGVLSSGNLAIDLLGGTQSISSAIRYGLVNDVEAGIYLDYAFSEVDESEQGVGLKARLLNQQGGDPVTASLVATLSLPNQPFINFLENDPTAFERSGLEKEVPILITGDDARESQLYITTVSAPFHYQFENNASLWLTPMLGYVQRNGLELAGINVGGAYPVSPQLNLMGEVGANLVEDGNMIGDDERENAIPWTVALQWQPSELLGASFDSQARPHFNLFVTNRVGFSPWQQMRVQNDDEIAVGLGMSIPVQF